MRGLTLGLSLAVALLGAPQAAHACSCAAGLAWALPQPGAQDVPVNAELRLGYNFEAPPNRWVAREASGATVNLDATVVQEGAIGVVTLKQRAAEPLRAGASYTLVGDGRDVFDFGTGAGPDRVAPTLGGITSISGGFDDGCSKGMCDTCGSSTLMTLSWDAPDDDKTSPADLLFRVFVTTDGSTPTTSSPQVTLPRLWPLGESLCTTTFPGLEVGDVVTVRAQTIDAAGNVSALSEPAVGVVEDDPDQVGCSGATATQQSAPNEAGDVPAPAWLLLGLGVVVARRARLPR